MCCVHGRLGGSFPIPQNKTKLQESDRKVEGLSVSVQSQGAQSGRQISQKLGSSGPHMPPPQFGIPQAPLSSEAWHLSAHPKSTALHGQASTHLYGSESGSVCEHMCSCQCMFSLE